MTLEQDTDLSSEGESFSTTFTTGQKYNNQDKSNSKYLKKEVLIHLFRPY